MSEGFNLVRGMGQALPRGNLCCIFGIVVANEWCPACLGWQSLAQVFGLFLEGCRDARKGFQKRDDVITFAFWNMLWQSSVRWMCSW